MLFPIPTVDPHEFYQTEVEAQEEKEADADKGDEDDAHPSESDKTDLDIPSLEKNNSDNEATSIFGGSPKQNDTNLDTHIHEEPPYATRTQKNHLSTLVIGNMSSPMLIRKLCKSAGLRDLQCGLLACFISKNEPKNVHESLKEPS